MCDTSGLTMGLRQGALQSNWACECSGKSWPCVDRDAVTRERGWMEAGDASGQQWQSKYVKNSSGEGASS